MKTKFLIGLAAAGVTFGSLILTLGPPHCNHHNHHCQTEQCRNEGGTKHKMERTEHRAQKQVDQF
jgi:hypothetical protein